LAHDVTVIRTDLPGARTANYIVAASNASLLVQMQADFVCTGTDDQDVIDAALDALPAGGGVVELTAGLFSTSDRVRILTDNVALRGQGASTIIRFDNTTDPSDTEGRRVGCVEMIADDVIVRDLMVDQNSRNSGRVNSGNARIHGIIIGDAEATLSSIANPKVIDCVVYDWYGDAISAWNQTTVGAEIRGNRCPSTYEVQGINRDGIFGGQGINFDDGRQFRVIGNEVLQSPDDAISCHNSEHGVILGNFITTQGGRILLNKCQNVVVAENVFRLLANTAQQATVINVSTSNANDENEHILIAKNLIYIEGDKVLNGSAIRIAGPGIDISVIDNLLRTVDQQADGIEIATLTFDVTTYGIDGLVVRGNTIVGFTRGIDISASTDGSVLVNMEVRGNTIRDCSIGVGISGDVADTDKPWLGRNEFFDVATPFSSSIRLTDFFEDAFDKAILTVTGYTTGAAEDLLERGAIAGWHVPQNGIVMGGRVRLDQAPTDDDVTVTLRNAADDGDLGSRTFDEDTSDIVQNISLVPTAVAAGDTHRLLIDDDSNALSNTLAAIAEIFYIQMPQA
jgi:hypothetical protein